MNIKYYVLDQSIVLKIGSQTRTISSSDYRYKDIRARIEQAKGNLSDEDKKYIASFIDPTTHLNNPNFKVVDGVVCFKEEPIPTILGDQFLEYKMNPKVFSSLTNFWFNIKKRLDFSQSQEIIRELISCQAYPITEDGFYLAYSNNNRNQMDSVLNKKNIDQKQVIHFYNISGAPAKYVQYFEQRKLLSEVLEEVFGFEAKKLYKLAVEHLFNSKSNFLDHTFFFYGETFKGILAPDNIYRVMEQKLLPVTNRALDNYLALREFFKDISLEKDGETYNQKKIFNLLESTKSANVILETGDMYYILKSKINMNIQEIGLSSSIPEIHAYLQKEMRKLKDPEFNLKIEENYPEFHKFDGHVIGGLKIVMPKTNYDLREWTNLMQNCIHSYADRVLKKQCIVFAVVEAESGKMLYNSEIVNGRVNQFSSRGNGYPNKSHRQMILKLFKDANLLFNTGSRFDDDY